MIKTILNKITRKPAETVDDDPLKVIGPGTDC